MSKPIDLGLTILDLTNIGMYEFWYDYTKEKQGKTAKFCYINTDRSSYTSKLKNSTKMF